MPAVVKLRSAVYLSRNKFSGETPDGAFEGMSWLKKLYLADNGFSGPMPKSLACLLKLLELQLDNNRFRGSIPIIQSWSAKLNIMYCITDFFACLAFRRTSSVQATTRLCAGNNKAPPLTKEHEHTAPKLIFVQQGGPRFELKDLLKSSAELLGTGAYELAGEAVAPQLAATVGLLLQEGREAAGHRLCPQQEPRHCSPREAQLDPFLSRYSVIIIDEAHERTVHTDVLLGLMKKVQLARSHATNKENNLSKEAGDGLAKSGNFSLMPCQNAKLTSLKLIIMSASLDARCFSEYFCGAKAVHIHGRQYPVEILYTYQPEPDYLDATLITIFQIHLEETAGDILAFLTGQDEIESVERLINERIKQLPDSSQNLLVVPIYASLPSEQQMNAFKPAPSGFRKVILATNIAETSVTIPGIKYVIDAGLVKARSYNPVTGMESLIIIPTSKAQALQRSGRAGREGPGKCFRLYPESEFGKLADTTVPEIKRCNLSNVVLQLKALGIDDIIGFDFMEKPSRMTIVKSLEQLFLLGALTDDYKLSSPVGHQMAKLPLDTMYSKALILAAEFKCLEEMLIVVAMLSVESIFYFPREKLEEARAARKSFSSPEGDHITMLNVYRTSAESLERNKFANVKEKTLEKKLNKWCRENFINYRSLRHARDIHSQIEGHIQEMGFPASSCGDNTLQFRRCLTASFFLNAAMKQPDGSYRALASGQTVQVHPSSMLFRTKADCIIYNELVRTNQNYIRNVTRVDPLWLPELAPQYFAANG
ncbi:pre-mRNA-splicing factor ATP-dependent RNA helicase DEAH10-like [Zingiber officinale]|uniref:pre-mRNA-splicing factor ATP-dependent RNA helicase DEAH10-like n=1 Tax=Zingiber officinale TaxID=94328 RepID=UPI001C4D246F|nr:pre-mRNA-splicing factor ATP-dependent RNA helicase DEAH10-like [Zingiber officinale]